MTREIKFRAWDIANKTMYEVSDIHFYPFPDPDGNIGEVGSPSYEGTRYFGEGKLEQVKLLQSTGLKDKNGKEIYEGDIFLLKTFERFDSFEQGKIYGNTVFLEGMFWIQGEDSKGEKFIVPLKEWNTETEIIGNIYEDNNLLTK